MGIIPPEIGKLKKLKSKVRIEKIIIGRKSNLFKFFIALSRLDFSLSTIPYMVGLCIRALDSLTEACLKFTPDNEKGVPHISQYT
jgi:hypothetical protein